ncbi:MAG: hypothetical protein WC373_12985, partial [Smithella sp.]
YKPEIFIEQYPLVKRFIYHLIYFREISEVKKRYRMQSDFWTHTINAHLIQASITWCMVFGSDGCNQTHWKKLSEVACEDLQSSFQQKLHVETGMTSAHWKTYWHEMTEFRNKYGAHRELNYDKPVPSFTEALDVALCYDRWIREVISPHILEEPPLEQFVKKLKEAFIPFIEKLTQAAKEYNETKKQPV